MCTALFNETDLFRKRAIFKVKIQKLYHDTGLF